MRKIEVQKYTKEDVKAILKWLHENYGSVEDELAAPYEKGRIDLPENFFEEAYEEALERAFKSIDK